MRSLWGGHEQMEKRGEGDGPGEEDADRGARPARSPPDPRGMKCLLRSGANRLDTWHLLWASQNPSEGEVTATITAHEATTALRPRR